MKQKIVIKVKVSCDKCRSKAMEIAADIEGVISVVLQGENKDRVVVIGNGVDSTSLAIRLGKKLGHASLETVEEVKEEPEEDKGNTYTEPSSNPTTYSAKSCQRGPCQSYVVVSDPYQSTCTIM